MGFQTWKKRLLVWKHKTARGKGTESCVHFKFLDRFFLEAMLLIITTIWSTNGDFNKEPCHNSLQSSLGSGRVSVGGRNVPRLPGGGRIMGGLADHIILVVPALEIWKYRIPSLCPLLLCNAQKPKRFRQFSSSSLSGLTIHTHTTQTQYSELQPYFPGLTGKVAMPTQGVSRKGEQGPMMPLSTLP